jgi:hypothetical protein
VYLHPLMPAFVTTAVLQGQSWLTIGTIDFSIESMTWQQPLMPADHDKCIFTR